MRSTGSGTQSKPLPDKITRRSLLAGAGGALLSPAILKAAPLGSKARIAVVGAGAFGAWTAEHLRRAGHHVVLVEAHGPAHSRSSSGGESRMTRGAYGKDAIYTRMAHASLAEWKALEVQGGLPIFHPLGVLFFTATPDNYFAQSLAVNRALGLPIVEMNRAQMAHRYPMIDFDGIQLGLFEPGFGALMARRAVQTLVKRHQDLGGYQAIAVASLSGAGDKLTHVRNAAGAAVDADAFVFACGPWMGKLFPDLLQRRIFATRQEVFFFAPPAGERMFYPGWMPGWADFNGGDVYYGFPDLEGRGVKIARDTHGPIVDPDTQSRKPSEAALADVVAYRDRRFPLLRGAALTEARVCQYENSSNGDFLIDFHPRWKNVLLVGGGSGHGFKHGPEVGRHAAGRLLGTVAPEPRFSLASKAETQNRQVH